MTNNTKELVWVVVNGFELALLPGENVAEAVAEMIAAKAEKGVSASYLADLRYPEICRQAVEAE